MSKKHMTALGKPFDMDALRAKNEKMRAVGNMNVNARGDIIDSNNNVISDSNKRVNVMYNKVMQGIPNPSVTPQVQPVPQSQRPVQRSKVSPADLTEDELREFGDDEPNPKK